MSPAFWVALYVCIFAVSRWFMSGKETALDTCYESIRQKRGGTVKEEPVGPFVNLVFGRNQPTYELRMDGLELTVSILAKQGSLLKVGGDLPGDIRITKEDSFSNVAKFFGKNDPEIGQVSFDSVALLSGDQTQLLSYLNRDARRATIDGLNAGAILENGVVSLQLDTAVTDPEELNKYIGIVLAMATHLRRGKTGQAGRLIHAIRTDTNKNVRENCLEALHKEHPNLPWTQALNRELFNDRSTSIRLIAARHAGQEGVDTLERLAMNTITPEETRMDAFLLFMKRCRDRERVHSLLEACLVGAQSIIARALQVACSQEIVLDAHILDGLVSTDDPEVQIALAKYSVVKPNRRSITRLVQLLNSQYSTVISAAAVGLSRIGTADVIPQLAETKGRLPRSEHGSIDDAILAIQARVSPTLVGGLTIDREAQRGGLSLKEKDVTHDA